MSKASNPNFTKFAKLFPKIELPVTLSEESQGHFTRANHPLPVAAIEEFIIPIQKDEIDEFTEFVACFQIPKAKEYVGLVYWKARLLTYEYILATFTKRGVIIDQQVLAGTTAEGDAIARTVCTIDEEWNIFVVGGVELLKANSNDGTKSEALKLSITEKGQIVVDQSIQEDLITEE